MELGVVFGSYVLIFGDGVFGILWFGILVNEYNKLILCWIVLWIGFGG